MGRIREEKRREEKREEKRREEKKKTREEKESEERVRRKKVQVREKVEKSRSTVFPMCGGSRGSKSRLAKAVGVEPSG